MKDVDYAKLSGQYASFLVAVGGVSITVLALVLSFDSKTEPLPEPGNTARVFLVAALITATVSCFIGAHMMAETAAFFTLNGDEQPKANKIPLGRRLFVLATTNIFIAITLVLFSIVLLPTATGKAALAASLKLIFLVVFLGVVGGALWWMALAAIERMATHKKGWLEIKKGWWAIGFAGFFGLVPWIFYFASKETWPKLTFIIIGSCTALSLFYFAFIFKVGTACDSCRGSIEMGVFSSAITISYSFLLVAFFKILWSS